MPDRGAIVALARALYEAAPRRRMVVAVPRSDGRTDFVRGDGSVIPWDEIGPRVQTDYLMAAARDA